MTPAIEQAAADWIARRYAGLTPEEDEALQRWLARDARHAATFAELGATWALLDRIAGADLPAGAAPDPDALAPATNKRRGRTRWLGPLLATAAAVALAYAGWWRPAQLRKDFRDEVVTAVGSLQKRGLPDGSVVRLNTDSHVEIHYSATERRVRLTRGEAHFTVAKNLQRPFFVEVGTVAVRAVGTAFNVRLREDKVEVLVTEGKVRVDEAAGGEALIAPRVATEPPHLVAGERAIVPLEEAGRVARERPAPVVVAAPEMERALAWRERRIEVVAAPLGEIVAEFNRYNRHHLVIADPALAARRFGGSFRADEPETFVRLLQLRFDLQVERSGDVTTLR